MNSNPLGDPIVQFLHKYALNQTKESGWYGYINVLLTKHLNECAQRCNTAIVPQLALSAEILDEDEEEEEFLSDADMTSSSIDSTDLPTQRPEVVDKSTADRSTSHSSHSSNPQSMKELRSYISFRIPDFVRLRQYNLFSANRVDLLVEVKRLPRSTRDRFTLSQKILRQSEEQAYHAFQADTNLPFVACIQALGDEWLYREIQRPACLTDLLQAKDRDPTYEPSPSVDGSPEFDPGNGPNAFESYPPPSPPLQIQQVIDGEWLCFKETHLAMQKEWLRLIHNTLETQDKKIARKYRV